MSRKIILKKHDQNFILEKKRTFNIIKSWRHKMSKEKENPEKNVEKKVNDDEEI